MFQFTKMLEPSPPKNYEQTESGRLILLPVAFPAKMYHAPALEKALKTAMDKLLGQGCGENTQESLANLDQNGLWQKMCEGCCQQVLISDREETSELFSGTWPTWGTMRAGRVTALKPLVRRTKEKESLSWPTPRTTDNNSAASKRIENASNRHGVYQLREAVQAQNWPTPTANEDVAGTANGKMQKMLGNNEQIRNSGQGALNADWVEILMGLPIGWTDIDKSNDELTPWPGWPAPMNATQKWATPNCMDMLPSRSFEAMKHQATNGARKNRKLPSNLREQIDPLMRKAYIEASQENGGCLEEEITVNGQYPYEPPRVVVGQKNRAKRLKCLGNGCCPLQVYPIFKIIMEVEKGDRQEALRFGRRQLEVEILEGGM